MSVTPTVLRNPEYTGKNRCIPCTVVNLIIGLIVAGALGTVSVPLGISAFVVCAGAVYFRGYLIPGTPTLTKRYLPDWLLRLFDKHPSSEPTLENDEKLDSEAVLKDAGTVSECESHDDLCLTPEFRTAWRKRIEQLRENDSSRTDLAAILGISGDQLVFEEHKNAFVAMQDSTRVGQWESNGAFLADLAAATELEECYSKWEYLNIRQQSSLLNGLRLFLEQCPSCGGSVTVGQEVVESCCRSTDVIAVTCGDCGARLFEAEQSPGR